MGSRRPYEALDYRFSRPYKEISGLSVTSLVSNSPGVICQGNSRHVLTTAIRFSPRESPTSSITAAVIGQSPPRVEIFFSEAGNPARLACVYSRPDPSFPTMWTWGTKYVADKPADSTIYVPKEKPAPTPTPPAPAPVPSPDPRYGPLPWLPRDPEDPGKGGRERNRCSYMLLGLGIGFVVGFVAGMILYEPFGKIHRHR